MIICGTFKMGLVGALEVRTCSIVVLLSLERIKQEN